LVGWLVGLDGHSLIRIYNIKRNIETLT